MIIKHGHYWEVRNKTDSTSVLHCSQNLQGTVANKITNVSMIMQYITNDKGPEK